MRKTFPLLAAAFAIAGCASTKPEVPLKVAVEVITEPENVEVRYKGKPVGVAPQSMRVTSYEELGAIVAEKPGLPVVERRVRMLSPDLVQLVLKLGAEPSPIAKKLGLTRVLVFEYAETVTFASSKSELRPESAPILKKQAEILNVYFPKANVTVCGFTDATGGDDLNDRLSFARAESVRKVLETEGVAGARLEARGFGKEFAAAPNDTPEGRARNRRTEVILPD
jgi:outer membrane protein OmpA-like peptidoglycan-associated protein